MYKISTSIKEGEGLDIGIATAANILNYHLPKDCYVTRDEMEELVVKKIQAVAVMTQSRIT